MISDYEKYDKGELLRGKYRKIADISEGSYGIVSLAKDVKNNDRLLAVKFIYPLNYKRNNPKNSSSLTKLRSKSSSLLLESELSILKALYGEASKEIEIHKKLGIHPNVTTLYDNFDSCLVLDYCSKGDLYEAIQKGHGPATSQDIKDVFSQILTALEYCHSHSVYHRDLKPENILIAEDWSIKICDWGLATTNKIITDRREFDIGSERYMAPELFDSSVESYDASKVDLWSTGIILLTLVFHKNPFQVASYSDKAFLQFARNREALFDIFSTMSSEMFSVLRFCLNIDPANRDLSSLRSELKLLKYFTIDEEYLASDYEEDVDLDEENFEDDDFYYGKGDKSLSLSPVKRLPVINSYEDEMQIPMKLHTSPPQTADSDNSRSSRCFVSSTQLDDASMQHNPRADALLSANTDLKPIPINESGFRFTRNARKPFNVASYHQASQNTWNKSSNSRFNREDYFTPKSIMNHYMDKYGDQRHSNNGKLHNDTLELKKSGNNRHSWKRNTRDGNSNGPNHRIYNKNHNDNQRYHPPSDSYCSTSSQTPKRKSNLFSKSRCAISTAHNSGQQGVSPHSTSMLSSHGKYVPPFLRSPHYRSPEIAPLSERIGDLSLDDEDEVFHLEDDFDFTNNGKQLGSNVSPSEKPLILTVSTGLNGDMNFKRPNFREPFYASDQASESGIGSGLRAPISSGARSNDKRQIFNFDSQRPSSTGLAGDSDAESSLSVSSASSVGKYIPPFRRGSHPANIPSAMTTGRGHRVSEKRHTDSSLKARNFKPLKSFDCISEVSSSLPADKSDWFSLKRE
ncbi:uncharacterized protein PRCAT00001587001 [Priceomyces carsonii]|uniref:uncharacterized protein n=1 Tax=Priceomyces carsonii TaxID=28549 RepID=UPI002ED92A3D|nr:unnamed protein product [Priceomyces carsonii]